jgi:enterochelin esterase-like enzyme
MNRLLFAAILLSAVACSRQPPTATPKVPVPSSSPAASVTPVLPTAVPSAAPRACLSRPGEILVDEIQVEGMARSLPYRVYLPPCFQPEAESYPVLILIHGLQSSDSQWHDLGVNEVADAMIRDGRLAPLVIAMPWERKGLEFESAVVDVLLPHIREVYAGEGSRATTAIGGLSRGAGWALRIGLQHPEAFGSIGLHSPAVLAPDMYYIKDWVEMARKDSGLPRLWIDIAERDTSRAGALELAALLDELDVPYAWSTEPGEHTASYWSGRLVDYLNWYGEAWKAPPAEAASS